MPICVLVGCRISKYICDNLCGALSNLIDRINHLKNVSYSLSACYLYVYTFKITILVLT